MPPLDLIDPPRRNRGTRHLPRAMAFSLLLHGVAFGSVIAVVLAFHAKLETKSGSIAGAPTIALEKMVIIPQPEPTTPPSREPTPPSLAAPEIAPPAPREPIMVPQPLTVPLLAETFPVHATAPHPESPAIPSADHHHIASTIRAASSSPASYAPGPTRFPHPPYPDEARDLGQTGTVLMNILFDGQGNVARADIAQTSGVAILDSATRAYIRRHWHSDAYARRSVTVPVEYTLQQM